MHTKNNTKNYDDNDDDDEVDENDNDNNNMNGKTCFETIHFEHIQTHMYFSSLAYRGMVHRFSFFVCVRTALVHQQRDND